MSSAKAGPKKTYLCWCALTTHASNQQVIEVDPNTCIGRDPEHQAVLELIERLGGKVTRTRKGVLRKLTYLVVEWQNPEMQAMAEAEGPVKLCHHKHNLDPEHQALLDALEQVGWTIEPQ